MRARFGPGARYFGIFDEHCLPVTDVNFHAIGTAVRDPLVVPVHGGDPAQDGICRGCEQRVRETVHPEGLAVPHPGSPIRREWTPPRARTHLLSAAEFHLDCRAAGGWSCSRRYFPRSGKPLRHVASAADEFVRQSNHALGSMRRTNTRHGDRLWRLDRNAGSTSMKKC